MSATPTKDLRTGRSVWEDRRLPPLRSSPLAGDVRTDVLAIGAGVSGAMIAEALTDAGYRVAVVDRRRPITGSTTASTALRAEFAWCGSFGGSATGTPTIGPVPGLPHCYAVLGYGGNGITFAALAAQLLRADVEGAPDPDADLFAFRRRRR